MRLNWLAWFPLVMLWAGPAALAGEGNRLAYLDEFCDPYYVGLGTAKLVTPQWIGEPGVEAVIVLSIDDMRDPAPYEKFLRPILDRLKKVDGRAPVSIMTNYVEADHPQLAAWFQEGVSVEAHTYDHPCPCLQGDDFAKAKATYDRTIDLLWTIPNAQPVAFRMPCCDSMNSVSPRFFTEIFNRTTPEGRFLRMNSSVFMLFTPDDPSLPRNLVFEEDGRQRFWKYVPRDRNFVNYVEDYPYPYVVARLCWEMPSAIPDDWQGHNLFGPHSPITVRDMKAAIDATVIKKGVFTLTHHPGGWIRSDQVLELVEHALAGRQGKVKFLNFREVHDRLTENLLGGHPLRAANGQDNGVRVLDLNDDGYMDVVVGNEQVRQTRLWSPASGQWATTDFPVEIVTVDEQGNRHDAGVRFGVLQKNGCASFVVRNEKVVGAWHFDGRNWVQDPKGWDGVDVGGPLLTSAGGRDRGVRLRDLEGDGLGELIVGNPDEQGVFRWQPGRGWARLPFALPAGTAIVDAQGRDAGLRLVDVDEDSHPDVVFSNATSYSLHLFVSMAEGWSREILSGSRGDPGEIPMIVRADGTNNGAWFKYRHMYVENEQTGGKRPDHMESRSYTALLDGDIEPPARSPDDSLSSMHPRPGFKVELMAAEPLVMDPIDIAWGPDGKAWVVEMADYPLGLDDKGKPGGRIKFLEDTDGDGRYDKSTLFLEPVAFPTGVMPWRQGVIVTAAPETFYAEDSDGDGKADLRRTLYSGFREGNQQHRVNHPRWGLDNWVYLANGDSGGTIRSAKTGEVLNIGGRDLRIRPDEGLLDAQTGQTQYGRNRDDWGNWFGCNNNNPGWYYAVADHYIRRNPHVAAPPGKVDLTGARDVYPAGRVITHCFIAQPTPPEGQPGYWTSVAGVMIYRDDLFGPEFTGNVFVEDSVYNVVHRMVLTREGVLLRGERGPDEKVSEFLASSDPYFRPATMRTGPDGALWVTDMYRFVIEHPEWISPHLAQKLELRRHCDKGRIYRVYPVDKKPRPIPRLDGLDTAGLVAALDSPSGWQRDMAQQMLLWRADKSAAGLLEQMATYSQRALARLHALCTLDGLGVLKPEIVLKALADEHPGVRRHAVRLSESLVASSPALGDALVKLVDDPDAQVRMQLAYSLGEWHDPRAGRALARLTLRDPGDEYVIAAVMSSAAPHVEPMLAQLKAAPGQDAARAQLIAKLEKLARDIQARPELTAAQDEARPGTSLRRAPEPNRERVEKLLGRAATVEQVQKVLAKYQPVLNMFGDPERGKEMFVEATCSTCHRFRGLGEEIGPDLTTLTDRSPQNLLVSVIDPNRAVLERFVEHIAVTDEGLTYPGMLLEETSNSVTLVNTEGKRGVILRRDLDELVYTGRSHMPEGLEAKMDFQQMADLFAFVGGTGPPPGQFPGNKPSLIRRGADLAFELRPADAEIYGPDVLFDSKHGILTNWTSEHAYVAWSIRNERVGTFEVRLDFACHDKNAGNRFVVEVHGNRVEGTVPGTGTSENYRQQAFGQIEIGPGRSLLTLRPDPPLNGPLMTLRGIKLIPTEPAPQPVHRNLPEKVEQADDGVLNVRATQAEVHGPGVAFEPKYGNLGLWYKPEGYGTWSIQVKKGGPFDLWLDWACADGTAGNRFLIEVNGQSLRGEVPGTVDWDHYRQEKFGQIRLQPGEHRLTFRSDGPIQGALIDLRGIKLVPAEPKE